MCLKAAQAPPVHVNDWWELQLLVYLLRAAKLGVELKPGKLKRQDRW